MVICNPLRSPQDGLTGKLFLMGMLYIGLWLIGLIMSSYEETDSNEWTARKVRECINYRTGVSLQWCFDHWNHCFLRGVPTCHQVGFWLEVVCCSFFLHVLTYNRLCHLGWPALDSVPFSSKAPDSYILPSVTSF